MIAPYQPAPSGPGMRAPPFMPGAFPPGVPGAQSRWGPGGYQGAPAPSAPATGASTGAKGLVEKISKGEVLPGADAAKRIVLQCNAAKTTPKHLADIICERTGRLYLGLDGDVADSDAAILRLLGLIDALREDSFGKSAVEEIKRGVADQLLSLRSSAKHKAEAEPMLRRLGLIPGGAPAQAVDTMDLLGGGSSSYPAREADLLGGSSDARVKEVDLLGGESSSTGTTQAAAPLVDLLLAPSSSEPASPAGDLVGLSLDVPLAASPALSVPAGASGAGNTMGNGAVLLEKKKPEDAFGFVGAEMFKAKK